MLPLRRAQGVTLIEVLISLALMTLLLALAAPSYQEWIQKAQIRAQGESIVNGVQLARSEALKRNTTVHFRLVTDLTSSCAGHTDGTAWVISLFDVSGLCDKAPDLTTSPTSTGFNSASNPLILQKTAASGANAQVAADQAGVCFNGLGQLTTVAGVCNALDTTIGISNPTGGSCAAAGGTMRCMEVRISAGGMIRYCDPAVSDTTDPRHC